MVRRIVGHSDTGDLHYSHGRESLAQPSEQAAYRRHAARGRRRNHLALYAARQTAGLHALAALVLRVPGRGDGDVPATRGISQAPPDAQDVATEGRHTTAPQRAIKRYANAMEPDRLDGKAKLLMIYIDENDWRQGEALYEAIVRKLRMLDLAGATVYRGILGYGAKNRLQ